MCLAVPMKVTEILPSDMAVVESGNISMETSTYLLEDVQVGDYVIIHAGFALEKLDQDAAEETLRLLDEMKKHSG